MSDDSREKLSLLQKCPGEILSAFLHRAIDGIHRDTPSPVYEGRFSEAWDLDDWWAVVDACQKLVKSTVQNNWEKDHIFEQLGDLSEDIKQKFCDAITARREEMKETLCYNSCAISNAFLRDFDWKVKMAVASDKLASVKVPITAIDLDIEEENGKRTVSLELTHSDLKNMLSSLEAANKVVSQLKI